MIGLVQKDFIAVAKKIRPLNRLIIAIILLAFLIFLKGAGAIFIGIVLPIFACSIPITLLTCDEQWRWDKYAITLPITKKEIVESRYITCGIVLGICFAISLLLNTGAYFVFHEFGFFIHLGVCVISLLIAVFYMLLIIPANYIFGFVGSSTIMIVLMGIVMAGTYVLKSFDIQLAVPTTFQIGVIIVATFLILIILGILSFSVSTLTYNKKHS